MAKQALFFALIPLVLFWAVEEFYGLKAALIVGVIAAVLEILYEKIKLKKVSFMTLASNFLVIGLGAVSFLMDSGVAFKLQPAVMEIAMAAFMFFQPEPLMLRMMREMKGIDEEKRTVILTNPIVTSRIKSANTRLIWFFVLHALAVAWAALYGSTRMWILLKGVLFYVLLVAVLAPMYKRAK